MRGARGENAGTSAQFHRAARGGRPAAGSRRGEGLFKDPQAAANRQSRTRALATRSPRSVALPSRSPLALALASLTDCHACSPRSSATSVIGVRPAMLAC